MSRFTCVAKAMLVFSLLGSFELLAQQGSVASSGVETRSEMMLLAVDKTELIAHLKTLPENISEQETLTSFKIAIGKAKGDKQKEGDNRTPEGIYFAQRHIEKEKLWTAKYGPRAIPLDFPNPIDRKEGKTGYGIWLHGAGNDERIKDKNVTEGCVAFFNSDILRVKSWIPAYHGIVVIAQDLKDVNREQEVAEVKKLTEGWISAWQNRDIDGYTSYYGADFRHGSRNLQKYSSYKSRVFKSYKKMTVDLTDLRVITHPKYAVAIMNQDFNGDDRFISKGRKVLFWSKDEQGDWRISREVFDNRRFETVEFSESDVTSLASNREPSSKESANKRNPSPASSHL